LQAIDDQQKEKLKEADLTNGDAEKSEQDESSSKSNEQEGKKEGSEDEDCKKELPRYNKSMCPQLLLK